MKLWEGLGYYNRARNLKAAAQTIVKEYDGKLPNDYDQLLSLKGIGMYTAGAIASIAYDIRVDVYKRQGRNRAGTPGMHYAGRQCIAAGGLESRRHD